MALIRKSIRRDEWDIFTKKRIKTLRVDEQGFCGTVCLLTMEKLKKPLIVSYEDYQITIADTDYKWLQFAPKNENWWLTVLFDREDHLIESYFDITKENNFENEDNPTFLDMYLDVVISEDRGIQILDEDELKEALNNNFITNQEYEFAFFVAKKIIKGYNRNKAKYYEFILRHYQELRNEKEV
ncbi:MAG: DUF402 domain-containing protein [Anaeroplasmataceae bacterium]|nr:DUF402 domain-containing protein [Anaeroplasmataceae bacterium]